MRLRIIIPRKMTHMVLRKNPGVPVKISANYHHMVQSYSKKNSFKISRQFENTNSLFFRPKNYSVDLFYKRKAAPDVSGLIFATQKILNLNGGGNNSLPRKSGNKEKRLAILLLIILLIYIHSCVEVSASEENTMQADTELDAKVKKALELFNEGDYVNTDKLLDVVIADYPNEVGAYELKAYSLCMQGKFDEAISTYKQAKRQGLSTPLLILHAGQAYLSLAEIRPQDSEYLSKKGLKYLDILIKDAALDKQLRGLGVYCLGKFYYKKGDSDKAIDFFKKSVELFKDKNVLSECCYYLGKIYQDKGEDSLALKSFIVALSFNRSNTDAFFSLGKHFEKLKLYNEAVECYAHVYDELKEPAALFLRAKLLKTLGYHEQACLGFDAFLKSVEGYEATDELNILKHDAHLLKAASLQQLQKHSNAADSINKAVNFNKNQSKASFLKILALLLQHKFDQAEHVINKAIESLPSSVKKEDALELYYTRALVYSELHEEKIKAIIEIKQKIAEGKQVNQNDFPKQLALLSQEAQVFKDKMFEDLKLVLDGTSNSSDNSARLNLNDKAQILLRRYQSNLDFLQKHEETALHVAVKNMDVKSVASLSSDKDIEARNEQYETPLHTAVKMGIPDIVEQLLKANANINAATIQVSYEEHTKDRTRTYPTAIEMAKEKKDWGILAVLLFSRQIYTEKDLAPIYDYYSGRLTREELSILLYQENIDDTMKHVQKYKAHLADRSGTVFETQTFGSLSHTQEVSLTGWDPRVFLTLRIMAFVQLLMDNHKAINRFGEITPTTFKDADPNQAKNYYDLLGINRHLKQEILYALELRRSMQDARIVYEVLKDNTIPQGARDKIEAAHLDRITNIVMNLQNGEQYPYLTGIFNHHYIYVNFGNNERSQKKLPYARIDNIGEAHEGHPYIEAADNKKLIAPCVINLDDQKELRSYIEDLFTARFTYLKNGNPRHSPWGIFSGAENKDAPKKRAYSLIYRKKCCSSEEFYTWPFKLPAVADNCSVKNYDIGAEIRMGSRLFHLIRREEYKKISEWDESFRSEWLKILDFDMSEVTNLNKTSQARAKL